MKKAITIIILLITALLLTGCGDVKASFQDDEFKIAMEERDFTVVDNTKKLQKDNKTIEIAYTATKKDKSYKLKYYSFRSEQAAQAFYVKEKWNRCNQRFRYK